MKGLAIDYAILLPALVPLAGLVLVLVADLVSPHLRRLPYAVAGLAALGSAAATVPGLAGAGSTRETFCLTGPGRRSRCRPAAGCRRCACGRPTPSAARLQLAAALAAAVCIALAWPRSPPPRRPTGSTREPVEAVLLLAALSGTVVVAASRDVGTWLVALELATLPVVVLVALSGRRSAVAGATQLLVTSLVSFALLVLGVALWFAGTGSPFLTPDAALSSGGAFSTVGVRRGVGRRVGHGSAGSAGCRPCRAGSSRSPRCSSSRVSASSSRSCRSTRGRPRHTPARRCPSRPSSRRCPRSAALAALLVVLRRVAVLGTPGRAVDRRAVRRSA